MTDSMIQLKGRHVTADRRLDRIPEFDPKSRRFGVAPVLPDKPPRSFTWRTSFVLDQGQEGACVGFGWSHELLARPIIQPGVNNAFAQQLYREAQQLDEWPGEDYSGTSLLAGAKAVQARGHMKEYRWGFSIDDLIMALGYQGPVVLGLNWYTGMMNTDAEGYIRPTGQVEGGHCIAALGWNVRLNRAELVNSWGVDWGNGGFCYIGRDDLERLLHEQGEQCIPVGRVKVV
ncbi:MAG TPA: C1 family peptidase [Actinomycetes bacterium]|nr:C1 family peptidase [Actinomycetes bacterium]